MSYNSQCPNKTQQHLHSVCPLSFLHGPARKKTELEILCQLRITGEIHYHKKIVHRNFFLFFIFIFIFLPDLQLRLSPGATRSCWITSANHVTTSSTLISTKIEQEKKI